ncbi:MAG: autotransporter-associated beta strand repeat-containing protein, partial [Verrucomicrobiae bacterium]|nr:autotransporter-associated beta strand repeat-containing protein [Verrucomicrobiae bacterium]
MKKILGNLFAKSSTPNQDETNSSQGSNIPVTRQLELDALEPRVLFSGAPVEAPDEAADGGSQGNSAGTDSPSASQDTPIQEGLSGDSTGLAEGSTVSLVGIDSTSSHLNQQTLDAIAEVAIQRWEAMGITGDQLSALRGIDYNIASMDGNRLGVANPGSITIDDDGAGRGWFVDSTPFEDSEFQGSGTALTATGGDAASGYDLLTTVMHEQGHILGLGDEYHQTDSLMYGYLQAGERRLAVYGQSADSVAGSLDGNDYLTAAYVWTGGAANGLMSDAGNWAGGIAPVENNDLVFTSSTSGAIINDFAPGTRFNTIQFTGGGYTLSGNALELSGGINANHLSGTNDIQVDITLINAQTIMNANTGGTLVISGDIDTKDLSGSTNVFGTSALTFDGSGSTEVSGEIKGAGSVYKLGSGTLTFSSANTYEGITDVRQGVLVVSDDDALGSPTSGETLIRSGASLHLSGGVTVNKTLSIAEGGVGFANGNDGAALGQLGALRSLGAVTNTWSGNIDLSGSNNLIGVDAGGTLNLSGVISNGFSAGNRLIKVGEGTLQLTGSQANVFRGETRVFQGTLELGKTAGVDAIGGQLVIGDELESTGTKTVRLLAANQIRHLDQYETGVLTITMGSTGVLDLNGFDDTIGSLTLTTGINVSSDVLLGGATLTMQGATLTVNGQQGSSGLSPAATIQGGTFDLGTFESTGGIAAVISGGGTTKSFVINDTQLANVATDLIISADIVGGPEISITRSGGGTLRLSGDNGGLTGPYLMTNGILELGSDTALGTGLVAFQNSANIVKAVGGPRVLSNEISLDGNITTLGDNLTINGDITLTGDRAIIVAEASQTVTINGVIGEGIYGNRVFIKTGRGDLVLTAANTYSGETQVLDDSGRLILRDNGTILNSQAIRVRDKSQLILDNTGSANLNDRIRDDVFFIADGGDLILKAGVGGTTETIGFLNGASDLSSGITVDSTEGDAHFIFLRTRLDGNADLEVNSIGGSLGATGANRVTFQEVPINETMTDGVTPRIKVRDASGLNFGTYASVTEGLALIGLSTTDFVSDINAAGPQSNVRLAAGVHTLTTSRTINSLYLEDGAIIEGAGFALFVDSGALYLGDGSEINTDTLRLADRAYITVDSGTATVSGSVIGSNAALSKIGQGKLVFSGDNHYSAPTFVNEGILNIQRSSGLGARATSGTGTVGNAGTAVRFGATLELEATSFGDIQIDLEVLTLEGTGFNDMGAIRNVSGNNSWAGNISQAGQNTNLLALLDGFPVANASQTWYAVESGSSLNLSGAIINNVELVKIGAGQLELSGVLANTNDATTRVLEGTLFLNKEPGVNAVINTLEIGSDLAGAPTATVWFGGSDQIRDDRAIRVHASGVLDLDGQSDAIDQLLLVAGATGSATVTLGTGTLSIARQGLDNHTAILLYSIGKDNTGPGASILGGQLALNIFGSNDSGTARRNRIFNVNDAVVGADLTITSAIVNGSGLLDMGISKSGHGSLELGGLTANTFTGDTVVSDGVLLFNKGDGSGGVNAIGGRLFIGDNNLVSGFSRSDVARWLQDEQLPDYLAPVDLRTTGWMDLNDHDETIGNVDAQTALTLRASSLVSTGLGTLTLIGNIAVNAAEGATFWTPVAPAEISGNLDLGPIVTTINAPDRSELPIDFIISANISGEGGIRKTDTGILLLSGNNTYTGSTFVENGGISIGSNTAFGTSTVYVPQGTLLADGGARTVSNTFFISGTVNLIGTNTVGGGGNQITFAGPVNLAGTTTINIPIAGTAEFLGGLGESFGAQSLSKSGFGTMVISSAATYSGTTTINTNGGTIVLADQGALLNTTTITVNVGGDLVLDNNSAANR